MRKECFALVFCLILLILLGCQQARQTEQIKIGAILALTGSIANQGEWVQNGLELAKEEINAAGGIDGRQLDIAYEDGQAKADISLSAYQNLRSRYHIPIIITMGSSVGIALINITNTDKVIQMGVATASPDYSTPNDFNFRVFETATLETQNLAREIKSTFGFTKIAVLWINNDYGSGVKTAFEKAFSELDGDVVYTEPFAPGETDFRTYLAKIESKYPDAIVLVPYTKEGGLILKQATELGMITPFFSTQAILGGQEFFDIAGESANGLLIAAPEFDIESNKTTITHFRESYQQKYNATGEIYGARSYDALHILADAIIDCGDPKAECVKEYLSNLKDYDGVSGKISFDENGDVVRPFELKQVRDGKIIPYSKE